MSEAPRWHNTVAITGAGSGLGAALARRYAAAGWKVAVTDIDASRAAAVAASLPGQDRDGPTGGFSMTLDVTRDNHWELLSSRVLERWGGLGVLINNAGVASAGSVEQTTLDDWQWVLDIDLLGVVRGCKQFSGLMRSQGRGHVVNIASFAGLAGLPGMCSYSVAKAGVVALSEGLRAELAPFGVGVSVVCPAFVATALTQTMRAPDPKTIAQVQRWMAQSGVSAEDVAEQVFTGVARKQFLVLTHAETRQAWRLKRWWPERYFALLQKKLATHSPNSIK
jgi:NAD(P)-dependent dehydrogenase (short-subunit alcohol dehydrogenase family)